MTIQQGYCTASTMGDDSSICRTREQHRSIGSSIKIEAEDWAAVKGILPGNLTMVTLAPREDGRIAEEYLFRNNPSAILNQTGSGQ